MATIQAPRARDLPEELFRWIVEAMPEAVVYADREGVIRLWNRGAETIFGYRQADALGQTLDLIVPERWRARHWEGYRTVMRTGVTRVLDHPPHGSGGTGARSRGHRSGRHHTVGAGAGAPQAGGRAGS